MRNHLRTVVLACMLVGMARPTPGHADTVRADLAPADGVVAFRAYGMGLLPLDGEFGRFHGSVTYDPRDHAACRVELRVDVASLGMSTDALRDNVLGPDFLDAGRFPFMEYFGACAGDGLEGRLDMHGVVRPFALTLDWTHDGVVATGRLRRADWGMTAMPVLGGSTVRIKVTVRLAGTRHAGP